MMWWRDVPDAAWGRRFALWPTRLVYDKRGTLWVWLEWYEAKRSYEGVYRRRLVQGEYVVGFHWLSDGLS